MKQHIEIINDTPSKDIKRQLLETKIKPSTTSLYIRYPHSNLLFHWIAENLKVNTSLKSLTLEVSSSYSFFFGGWEALCEVLKNNTTLNNLCITGIKFQYYAVLSFSQMITVNKGLLSLSFNCGNDTLDDLVRPLTLPRANRTLTEITLTNDNFDNLKDLKKLIDIITQNEVLTLKAKYTGNFEDSRGLKDLLNKLATHYIRNNIAQSEWITFTNISVNHLFLNMINELKVQHIFLNTYLPNQTIEQPIYNSFSQHHTFDRNLIPLIFSFYRTNQKEKKRHGTDDHPNNSIQKNRNVNMGF